MRDRLLHHLGTLQNEWQNELAATETIADVFHRRQKNRIEHFHRRVALQRLVDLGLDAVFATPQDRLMDALLDGRILSRSFDVARRRRTATLIRSVR